MPAVLKNLVGVNVRKMRTEAGLTQDALAAILQRLGWDLARGTLAKIEAGLRRVNDAELFLLAEGLGKEPGELLMGSRTCHALVVARQGPA